jgi:hypothetical protein
MVMNHQAQGAQRLAASQEKSLLLFWHFKLF